MQTVPLQPVPSQQMQIVLGGQNCQLSVYLRGDWLFVDVNANGVDISIGVIAMDAVPLIPTTYLGFQGNLLFTDTQGNSNPTYDGLGSRYQLFYLSESEAAAYGFV